MTLENESRHVGRHECLPCLLPWSEWGFNTKIGLSICATIGWCSLCDEPSNFGRGQTIVGLLENCGVSRDLSEGEISSILTSQLAFTALSNHLVRSRQHIRRNRQTDLLGGLEVDHQLELSRPLNGQISRLGSL